MTEFGLNVDGVRRMPVPKPGVDRVYTSSEPETAVADARFVVLAVPLTDETQGLVDGDILAAIREDAYLIRVAGGGVLNQNALVTALEDGDIAGAVLDVFDTEPLPESSPLWEMDEVIVSPHCGAFTRDYATTSRPSYARILDDSAPMTNRPIVFSKLIKETQSE